jgi:hypothetical protein
MRELTIHELDDQLAEQLPVRELMGVCNYSYCCSPHYCYQPPQHHCYQPPQHCYQPPQHCYQPKPRW